MNLSLIIGGVIVVIILYIIWGYFFTTTQVLMSFQAADTQTIVRGNTIAESGRNVYSFSLWTYINDWGQAYGQEKNILEVATSPPPSPAALATAPAETAAGAASKGAAVEMATGGFQCVVRVL